jgi:hypothetical protein
MYLVCCDFYRESEAEFLSAVLMNGTAFIYSLNCTSVIEVMGGKRH